MNEWGCDHDRHEDVDRRGRKPGAEDRAEHESHGHHGRHIDASRVDQKRAQLCWDASDDQGSRHD